LTAVKPAFERNQAMMKSLHSAVLAGLFVLRTNTYSRGGGGSGYHPSGGGAAGEGRRSTDDAISSANTRRREEGACP
jgi:hypothetical protein